MKYTFCQVSATVGKLTENPSIEEEYYEKFWSFKKSDGYYKPGNDFWEIPKWIAEVDHIISFNKGIKTSLKILIKPKVFVQEEDTTYLFSVMDVNKAFIEQVVSLNVNLKFGLGGYVQLNNYYPNVTYYEDTKAFALQEGLEYSYGTDYHLFKGRKCIPRLTLSTGCKHQCKFCTVGNKVIPVKKEHISQQLESFKDLDFKLIYIDDKTFGQCETSIFLKTLVSIIKRYNKKFKGFIIQTTSTMVCKEPELFNNKWIYVVEIGLETYNNAILKQMNKPSNEMVIDEALKILNAYHKNVIPNIILGLPGETFLTYNKTLKWIQKMKKKLYSLNIYSLALYDESQLGKENPNGNKNESKLKSEKTDKSLEVYDYFYDQFFMAGMSVLTRR